MSVGINANLIYASIRDRNQNQAALDELDPDVYYPEEYASGAQADGDYLKSIIDKYEKKGIAGMGFSGGASGTALPPLDRLLRCPPLLLPSQCLSRQLTALRAPA